MTISEAIYPQDAAERRSRRRRLGFSQSLFAEILVVDLESVELWERGLLSPDLQLRFDEALRALEEARGVS